MAQRPVGPYLVEQRIASGGMAEVFVAKRVGPHGFWKRVALKRILPQFARDPDFVAMFIDEARLAAQLEHPNIVHVFDFGELSGDLFLAMELVEGTNVNRLLRAVAARSTSVPVDVALHIAAETARALAYAHGLRDEDKKPLALVHRDVSPANLLLTRTGHVKLSDFGIARAASTDHRTDQGRLRGKLGYMSPEQVLGKPLDGRTDVFTLTTVLTEMLLAEPLFGTGSDLDVLLRIRDVDLRMLERTDKRIPTEVRRLLTLGLSRKPEDRPNAAEFADHIAEVLRRRGRDGGPERVARYLAEVELVEPLESAAPREGLRDSMLRFDTSDVDASLTAMEASVETAKLAPGQQQVTAPAIWRVRLGGGEIVGPMSFPKLVEMFTTGTIDARAMIAKGDAPLAPAASHAELTRFVTSRALGWDGAELEGAAFRGDITPGKLLPLVFKLAIKRDTGVLQLADGHRKKKVYFVDGRPEFVASTDRRELLGEFLVAENLALRMEVEMGLALLPRYGGHLGDALVGLGVLRPVELFRAIAAQVSARYREMFRWRRGTFAYVRDVRSHEETFPLGHDPFVLLREAVDATPPDELVGLLAPLAEKVLLPNAQPPVPLAGFLPSEAQRRVIESVKGDATIAAIVARETSGGMDADDVYRALHLGLACELLRAQ